MSITRPVVVVSSVDQISNASRRTVQLGLGKRKASSSGIQNVQSLPPLYEMEISSGL